MAPHGVESPAQVVETLGKPSAFQIHMEGERCPTAMAVLHYKGGDAIVAEPLGHLVTLTLLIQPEITAARTDDDARPRGILLGDESPEAIGLRNEAYQQKAQRD